MYDSIKAPTKDGYYYLQLSYDEKGGEKCYDIVRVYSHPELSLVVYQFSYSCEKTMERFLEHIKNKQKLTIHRWMEIPAINSIENVGKIFVLSE